MPEISRFLGIVIAMYYTEHGVPHFHAAYGDAEVSIEVETAVVHGHLHRQELLDNWQRARAGEPLTPIAPLE